MKVHLSKGYFWSFLFSYTPEEFNESRTNESLWLIRLLYLLPASCSWCSFLNIFYGIVIQIKPEKLKDTEASKLNDLLVLIPKFLSYPLVILV